MREILYRGQIRRKGEKVHFITGEPQPSRWCYGGIFAPHMEAHGFGIIYGQESGSDEPITGTKLDQFPVYRDTVGQYTGLTDKNGAKIFEGDIVEADGNQDVVRFENGCFYPMGAYIARTGYEYDPDEFEIVGNIFDNPELLEVKK